MTKEERQYWIALAYCESFTPSMWDRALGVLPSAEAVWRASQRELEQAGVTPAVAANLVAIRDTLHPETIFESLEKYGIHVITIQDADYPRLLKNIFDPPHVLFVQGALTADEPVAGLGVVGTRKISSYGKTVLPPIVTYLVQNGITIVSGLALGVDGVAHEATLAAHGRTVAVIGTGIDRQSIYPFQHRYLADAIVAGGGAIVSEYAPGTLPTRYHFPARNRIVSGMSHGIMVCDCPEKSGALITAEFAIEHGRELFAIPGPIHHVNAAGPNGLIKNGAIPVTSPHDILDVLHISTLKTEPGQSSNASHPHAVPANKTEQTILASLADEPQHVDALVRTTGLTSDVIASTLVIMEMNGKVRNVGYGLYTQS